MRWEDESGKMRVGEIMNSQVIKYDSRDCIAGQCVIREVEVEVEGGDRSIASRAIGECIRER